MIAAVIFALLLGAGAHYVASDRQERASVTDEAREVVSGEPAGEENAESSGDIVRSPDVLSAVSGESLAGLANIAIVMDDCGPSLGLAQRVLSLNLPITWSILPYNAHSKEIAEMLREAQTPFLVHVPMQAQVDPDGRAGQRGMYNIGVGMSADAVVKALSPLIDSLPGAYGVNNHRGSRATEDAATMGTVMDELAKRKLFFLDSSTSSKTVAYQTAQAKGLRTLKNWHFLDNEADRAKIAAEMRTTITAAKKRGDTVVICHLRPETVAFLEDLAGWDLASMGARLVTLPQLAGQ